MALSNIDAVRLKTGDKSKIEREEATGDGNTSIYQLANGNVVGTTTVWIDGVLTTNYTLDAEFGLVSFTLTPFVGSVIVFQYYWAVYSDEEVDYFLTESGGNVTLACVMLLMSMAADAAKLAMRETMGGGGGTGSVTRDTSLTAQELRETANVLYKQYGEQSGGTNFPADGLTELAWTVHMDRRMIEEDFYRDGG